MAHRLRPLDPHATTDEPRPLRQRQKSPRCLGSDDGVAKDSEAPSPSTCVQPTGRPIIHSTNSGFGTPPRTSRSCGARLGFGAVFPLVASEQRGVGSRPGEAEPPAADVRGSAGGRREHAPLRIEPELGQRPENSSEAPPDGGHVLHEQPSRLKNANTSDDF